MQLHINSPEDELRMRFRDLVNVGEECARHGVKAIQLVGWNDGGQDQGNPSHDHDPRLGTADGFRAAIKAIQALGVKLILFTKFVWADRATERFRTDLIRQAIKDPWGDYYMHPGYQYQTATQLLDVNTKRLIPMCFLSEGYLRVCDEEFRKVRTYGADGILYDECLHHGPALLCFDLAHGHRPGAPVYANDRELGCRAGRQAAAPVRRGAIGRIDRLQRRYLAILMRGGYIATSTPGAKCTSGASTVDGRPAASTRSSSRLMSRAACNAYGWCLTRTLHRVAPRCT
jgi:hypothetical protein